jgi:hypothetical protein
MASTNPVAPSSPVPTTQQFYWPQDLKTLALSEEDARVIEIALRWARSTQKLLPYSKSNEPYVMEKDDSSQGETGSRLPCRVEVWSDGSLIQTSQKLWVENSSALIRHSGVNAQFYCPDNGILYRKKAVPKLADQADVITEAANQEIENLLQEVVRSGKPLEVCSSPEDFEDSAK